MRERTVKMLFLLGEKNGQTAAVMMLLHTWRSKRKATLAVVLLMMAKMRQRKRRAKMVARSRVHGDWGAQVRVASAEGGRSFRKQYRMTLPAFEKLVAQGLFLVFIAGGAHDYNPTSLAMGMDGV